MTEALNKLVEYRLKRSAETLEEAKILADASHRNACVNRLYYTCFYAVSALLLVDDLSSSKHTGIRSLFNKHYVKNRKVSKELAQIYNDLFERRREGDYVDFFEFEQSQVNAWIPQVKKFLESIKNLMDEKMKKEEP